MSLNRTTKTLEGSTAAQSLDAFLASARDSVRKDKGLKGDIDPLTRVTFLKSLDDLEIQREEGVQLAGKKFKPAVEPPYRWCDWAARSDGITGDELLAFVNNEETTVPSPGGGPAKKGAGLFHCLRTCSSQVEP
jgi:type I restriction enzyme M protein